MSLDALCAQLLLKERSLSLVLEGQTEQDIIHRSQQVDDLDAYFVGDLDVPETEHIGIFGNKGRVVAVLQDPCISEYADDAIIGIIDRDLDYVLRRVVEVKGVYYSDYACFASVAAKSDSLEEIFAGAFGKSLPEGFVDEVMKFGFMMFGLRAWIAKYRPGRRPPRIEGRVRRISSGGFDWTAYLSAASASLGGVCSAAFLKRAAKRWSCSGDARMFLHFHSTVEYVWRLGRKEGLLDSSVKEEEVYRHFRTRVVREYPNTQVSALISKKLAARFRSSDPGI